MLVVALLVLVIVLVFVAVAFVFVGFPSYTKRKTKEVIMCPCTVGLVAFNVRFRVD